MIVPQPDQKELNFPFDCRFASFGANIEPAMKPKRYELIVPTSASTGCAAYPLEEQFAEVRRVFLVQRGECAFGEKLHNTHISGADGMVVINLNEELFEMGSVDHFDVPAFAVAIKLSTGKKIRQLFHSHYNAAKLWITINTAMSSSTLCSFCPNRKVTWAESK